jgi:hypothetical protein
MSSVFSGYLTDNANVQVDGATAAGTSAVDSTAVDMAGYDGVLFIVQLGTAAANNTIKAQQDSAVAMSGAADLTGTSVASGTKKTVVLDVQRPAKQFVRCEVTRGTSTTVDAITTIRYKARALPVGQPTANVMEQWSSPAEGTA